MQKSDVVRILLGNGFDINSADSTPNYILFEVARNDLFGAQVSHRLAVGEKFSESDLIQLVKIAARDPIPLVVIGSAPAGYGLPTLTFNQFEDRLGGNIISHLPLHPEFSTRLVTLSNNTMPDGLEGDADTLFETYVHAGLQYLVGSRCIKYGQERNFDSVPDGIVYADRVPLILYDAKAASQKYEVTAASIRQFASYVSEYNAKYQNRTGSIYAFMVISSEFTNGKRSRQNQSDELRGRCGAPLVFVTADVLAALVEEGRANPIDRSSIDWRRMLAKLTLEPARYLKELEKIEKDQI